MHISEINALKVSNTAEFYEVYYKFYRSTRNILLVVDGKDKFIGLIGLQEMLKASNLIIDGLNKLTADEICNKSCQTVLSTDNVESKCLDLFILHSFKYIPIISTEMHVTDLADRNEFHSLRFFSYAGQNEDIVINHVLRNVSNVFYIDVGANDPIFGSVTKWLYDSKCASGINIEPLESKYQLLCRDRPKDCNINTAIGSSEGELAFYTHFGTSTCVKEYADDSFLPITVPVITLKQVCEQYVPEEQEIHFLKIDVEGFEKEVLLGADFRKYRPWVVMLESTIPNTEIASYLDWEHLLLTNEYIFAKQYGINRFYLANERIGLIDSFLEMDDLRKRYIVVEMKTDNLQL